MNKKILLLTVFILLISIFFCGCERKGVNTNVTAKKPVNNENSLASISDTSSHTSSNVLSDTSSDISSDTHSETSSETSSESSSDISSETSSESSSNVSSETPETPEAPEIPESPVVIGTTSKGYEIISKNGAIYINGIVIANKSYALDESYKPGLNAKCKAAFNVMAGVAKLEGIDIWISSGYRSYSQQDTLHKKYCNNVGVAAAETFSARAGHSEHQTGLAIDVNSASSAAYETIYKHVGQWLEEHAYEYGFIIRYPKGKESVTGYVYEPWHIRYVGADLALTLKENGLTLEEYLGITSQYNN